MADDEATYKTRLGAVITELRLARGYKTQLDFADAMGVNVSTIQRWETAKTMPNAWDIRALADKLAVDPMVLINPPDRLPEDVLDVSRIVGATVRREIAKRAARRGPQGGRRPGASQP